MNELNTQATNDGFDDLFAGCLASEPDTPVSMPTQSDVETEAAIKEVLPDFDTLAVGEKIAKNTVVLEMHIGTAGVRRKLDAKKLIKNAPAEPCGNCYAEGDVPQNMQVPRDECDVCLTTGTVKRNIDPNSFHASKDIIDPKELKSLNKRISQLKKFRASKCVKASMLANGFYVLQKDYINAMDAEIESATNDIEAILNEMEPRWESICEAQKPKLGEHWDRRDYPSFAVWRNEWVISSRLRGLNVPALLNEYNEKIAKREYEKLRLDWADTAQEVRDALRSGFTFLVKDFAGKLGRDDEGKFKTFTKNLVEKLSNFCATFEARDLTGDADLSALAKQVQQMVEGVDPKALRKDEALRGALELAFTKIADEAAKLVVVRERTIAFDDEDL